MSYHWQQGCADTRARNSSLLEDTSHQKLMHCHGSKRHSQSCCGPQGCFGTLAENNYHLWASSGICPFFSFLVVVAIWLRKAGRMVTHGLGLDPVGSVFLTLSQGIILVSPRAGDPLPWGFLGCLEETEVAGTHSHNFTIVTITLLGGMGVCVSNPPLKRTWVVGEWNPVVTGLHNYC